MIFSICPILNTFEYSLMISFLSSGLADAADVFADRMIMVANDLQFLRPRIFDRRNMRLSASAYRWSRDESAVDHPNSPI